MLVLSRQRDESIIIGEDIIITVVDIRGEKVRLGVSAPPHISVHRKEVFEAIKRDAQVGVKQADSGQTKPLEIAKQEWECPQCHDRVYTITAGAKPTNCDVCKYERVPYDGKNQ